MKRKRHPLWAIWHSIKQRCENSNRKDYKYYGGRGIKVCDEWMTLNGFIKSVPQRPSPEHTLDRIDPEKDYCPENVRWATRKQQSMNCSHTIIVNGKSLSDWSKELKCSLSGLSVRYAKYGESCLSNDFVQNGIAFNGRIMTLSKWAELLGISGPALRQRIEMWGVEKALSIKKYETRKGNRNAEKCQ